MIFRNARFYILLFTSLLIIQCKKDGHVESRKELLAFANAQKGVGYDSANKNGYDCSGFVQKCYSKIHMNVPRSSEKQSKFGRKITLKNARLGDVLIFTGSNSKQRKAGHSALLYKISNDTIFFIHSSTSSGVMINNLTEPYYSSRFLQVRRYFE